MSIETKFNQVVKDWKAHCESVAHSSNARDYLNCEAYRDIVSLGLQALPFIRSIYAGAEEDAFFPIFGWTSAVREIVGEKFQIPEEFKGRVESVRDYTIKWLDENMSKYV